MKAVGYKQAGPISEPNSLIDCEQERPSPKPHDLIVEVKGISVNPVDVKVRATASLGPEQGETKVIGYDASGVVREVGDEVTLFAVGDEVFYAGDLFRPGTNSQFHAVDERIVGKKPCSLTFPEAASLPLTSITAWEILFDSFNLNQNDGHGETLLIIGAAGGVGSILTQLAKKLTKLTVVATASRPDTIDWVTKMGADHVINHREPLAPQLAKIDSEPKYVASLNGTQQHFPAIIDFIKPRGHITIIDDPESIDIGLIKLKALTFSWEFMFARSLYQTTDMIAQHNLLNEISRLIDDGTLTSTVTSNLGTICANSLKIAHQLQESGKVIGKNVLNGFTNEI